LIKLTRSAVRQRTKKYTYAKLVNGTDLGHTAATCHLHFYSDVITRGKVPSLGHYYARIRHNCISSCLKRDDLMELICCYVTQTAGNGNAYNLAYHRGAHIAIV